MSLHQLRLLREIAERRTIAAAAEALGYTPSAVSQQIGGLEKATGVAVLERVGRSVRLTDAGRELVRHADGLLSGMEAARAAIERVGGEARGEIDMSVFESFATTLLAPLLRRLSDSHPDLMLRTRQVEPDDAVPALSRGDLDLALTIDYPNAPVARADDQVLWPMIEDRFHLVVAADDELRGPVIDLAQVADRPFISALTHLNCGRCVRLACLSAGFEPRIVHQFEDYSTTLQLVAGGAGVALIPDLGLVNAPPGVRKLNLAQPLSRVILLAARSASAQRPALVAVREAMHDVCSELALVSAAA